MSRKPNDHSIRSAFFQVKETQYRRELKHARNTFQEDLSKKLENASEQNPNIYWKLIEQLKQLGQGDEEEISPISEEDRVEHFKGLFKAHTLTESDNEILQELEKAEQQESI